MAEFEPITSQEMLDSVIKDRINRLNEKHAKEISEKYGDYDSLKSQITSFETQITELNESLASANEKITGYDAEIAKRDATIKDYELNNTKMRIVQEVGLSMDAIGFLQGDDEEMLRNSAESLKSLVGTRTAPSAIAEPSIDSNSDRAAYQSMLANLI